MVCCDCSAPQNETNTKLQNEVSNLREFLEAHVNSFAEFSKSQDSKLDWIVQTLAGLCLQLGTGSLKDRIQTMMANAINSNFIQNSLAEKNEEAIFQNQKEKETIGNWKDFLGDLSDEENEEDEEGPMLNHEVDPGRIRSGSEADHGRIRSGNETDPGGIRSLGEADPGGIGSGSETDPGGITAIRRRDFSDLPTMVPNGILISPVRKNDEIRNEEQFWISDSHVSSTSPVKPHRSMVAALESPFAVRCPICTNVYKTRDSLRHHMRKIHREKMQGFEVENMKTEIIVDQNEDESTKKNRSLADGNSGNSRESGNFGNFGNSGDSEDVRMEDEEVEEVEEEDETRFSNFDADETKSEGKKFEFENETKIGKKMEENFGGAENNEKNEKWIENRKSNADQAPKNPPRIDRGRNWECPECDKVLKTRDSLRHHIKHSHRQVPRKRSEDMETIECNHCSKKLKGQESFNYHQKEYHSSTAVDEKIFSSSNGGNIPCPYKCGKVFKSNESCKHHVKYIHELTEMMVCSECGQEYVRKYDLLKHRRQKHGSLA